MKILNRLAVVLLIVCLDVAAFRLMYVNTDAPLASYVTLFFLSVIVGGIVMLVPQSGDE